ncbi:MAG: hypothetical protein ABJD11_18800, partial [Gemmatimonadota bacterium]
MREPKSPARWNSAVPVLAGIWLITSLIGAARPAPRAGYPSRTADQVPTGNLHDWDFLVGHWTVRHHRLKTRLVGSTEWEDFAGTLVNWPTLGGQGNVGDNVMDLPSGTIRGVGIRAFDVRTGEWLVWWLDARHPEIAPPIRGGFKDGV